MVRRGDHDKVRSMLKDTITLLCKNGLSFRNKFTIEAVIGVTLDDEDVMLLSISELVKSSNPDYSSSGDTSGEDIETGKSLHKKKGHKRKRRKHSNRPSKDSELEYSDGQVARINNVGSTYVNTYIVDSSNHQSEAANDIVQSDAESDKRDDLVFVKQEMDTGWSQAQSAPTFPDFSDLAASQHPELNFNPMSLHQKLNKDSSVNYPPIPGIKLTHSQENIWQSVSPQQQYSPAGSSAMTVTPTMSQTSSAIDSFSQGASPQKSENEKEQQACQYGSEITFVEKSDQIKHKQGPPRKKIYPCPCGKSYKTSYSLQRHKSIQHPVKPVMYECDLCSYKTKYRSGLVCHKESKHEGKNSCNVCEKSFSSWSCLTRHIRDVHEGIRHQCPHCDKNFSSHANLKKHVDSLHGASRYLCRVCGKVFKWQSSLNKHSKCHK